MLSVFLNQSGDFKNKNKASLTLYEPKHYRLMKLKSQKHFAGLKYIMLNQNATWFYKK